MKKVYFLPFLATAFCSLISGCCQEPDSIASLPSQYVTLDDSIQIHYKQWGNGAQTVMFVHGFGCDMNTWEAQFDAFREEKDMRLLFIDLPGYGQSDKPHVDYTLSFFSKSIVSVLHEVNCDYVHLVGHSLGTPVCRQTAYEHPSNIAGIMDIDGVYCFYPKLSDNPTEEELAAATAYEEAVQGFAASFDGDACKDNISGFVLSLASPQTPTSIIDYAMSCMPETPEYVASSTMHNLIDRQWWHGTPIQCTTEVICTQNSGLEPDNQEMMQALYPSMEYTELETCGHFIQMEQPQLVNDCLKRLISTAFDK